MLIEKSDFPCSTNKHPANKYLGSSTMFVHCTTLTFVNKDLADLCMGSSSTYTYSSIIVTGSI